MQQKELIPRFSVNECLFSVQCPGCHRVYKNGYEPRGDGEYLAEAVMEDQIVLFNKDFWEERILLFSPSSIYYELHWYEYKDGVMKNQKGCNYILPFLHRLFSAQFETEEEMNQYTSGFCCGGIGFRSYRVTDNYIYQLLEENGRWKPYWKNGVLLYSHLEDYQYYSVRQNSEVYIYL
jgi:hypothetical protein